MQALDINGLPDSSLSPSARVEYEEFLDNARTAIANLPQFWRQVMRMVVQRAQPVVQEVHRYVDYHPVQEVHGYVRETHHILGIFHKTHTHAITDTHLVPQRHTYVDVHRAPVGAGGWRWHHHH